jgi:RimJ/RimL family protein N-acetyltransferase
MNIKGKFVTLRQMRRDDMQMICDMFNDPELEDQVVGWAFPLSIEQQQLWFEKNINDNRNFRFVIETIEDGAVGIATLIGIDWKNRRASHGIKIANKERRAKGVGTDTVMAIMRYVFDELGLHRLDTSWFDSNVASKTLYTKCGWKVEGVKREYIFKRGQWRDLTVVGILESDYRELISNNHYWD